MRRNAPTTLLLILCGTYLIYDHMHLTSQYMEIKDKSVVWRRNRFACSFYSISEEQTKNYTGAGKAESHIKENKAVKSAKDLDKTKTLSRSHNSSLEICPLNPTHLGKYSVHTVNPRPWWRHQMETFSALVALWEGNPPVTDGIPHKGQWCWALMFSLICVWTNTRDAGDFRCHRARYDATVT